MKNFYCGLLYFELKKKHGEVIHYSSCTCTVCYLVNKKLFLETCKLEIGSVGF